MQAMAVSAFKLEAKILPQLHVTLYEIINIDALNGLSHHSWSMAHSALTIVHGATNSTCVLCVCVSLLPRLVV